MRNLKHTIMAIVSVAMVGTLSFFQVSDLSAEKLAMDSKLSTANNVLNITVDAENQEDDSAETQAEESDEVELDEVKEQTIAEKSSLTSAYAKVTGTADLKAAPSDEAETIGTMGGADSLEILESTEDWYKVFVNCQSGYVKKDLVTLDKTEADTAAKQYDNYKKATVSAESGLMVRTAGSSDASGVGTVDCGAEVIIVDRENDYIKILYGEDYTEGYVINSGLDITGEWVAKDDVHAEIKKVAAEKEAERIAAEKKAAIEKENARLAAMGYSSKETKSTNKTKSTSTSTSTSTGNGQAIVNTAMKYLGVPYVWGGTSPSGFDCSGLVQYVCRQNGISVPRVAASQRGVGKSVSRADLQPGDLVFFSSGGRVSHVGIYIGNGNMIHAPQTGDVVKISSINSSYRVKNYAGAVRVW